MQSIFFDLMLLFYADIDASFMHILHLLLEGLYLYQRSFQDSFIAPLNNLSASQLSMLHMFSWFKEGWECFKHDPSTSHKYLASIMAWMANAPVSATVISQMAVTIKAF